ncbi:AraC family transcriptional regulator [Massilia sp. PAMC28688]|uniref:AraC family transcriptional regulator n=1 Tax=Massilia sp. PAMC28688 TaxID=2861283 RepID=UPI001C625633|nr:AraC family transcriptional regulator [Massilia sp. PAMC28688]QYF95219.1 AraC family transcriptional regulator [Massilia sp. PAMC28688]
MSTAFAMPGLSEALITMSERQLFASRDLAQTRSLVGTVMKPHDLQVRGSGQQVNARMHHMAFGGVSLNRLKYGADVEIEPGPLGDFYLVQMPLDGHALITSGTQRVGSNPDVASVLSPCDSTVMHWSGDCDQLMVRIDRLLVDRAAGALSGRLEPETIRFQLGFRWRECPPWRCLVQYLNDCASHPFDPCQYRLLVAHLEQMVVATLLAAQPHDMRQPDTVRCTAVLPRHVKRVQEFLRANAGEPVSADQMALVAGVSLRSLYAGFKEYCGVSPMQYLRTLRLDGARQALLSEPNCHIATIAMRWGFAHLGRFSVEYKERFGESPSQSLRRR